MKRAVPVLIMLISISSILMMERTFVVNSLTFDRESQAEIMEHSHDKVCGNSILGGGQLVTSSAMSNNGCSAVATPKIGNEYILYRTTTCKSVQSSSPYDPIEETEAFKRSDSDAYVWIHLTYVYRELNVKWKFLDPDGNLYWEAEYTVPDPSSEGYDYWEWYKCWDNIYIQGHLAEDMEGKWTTEIYIDEGSGYELQATEQFVIGYWITDWTMAKNVQSSDPYEPIDPTTFFLNTDEKAFGWIRLDELAESIEIKWEWYEPSGALYFSYENITEDPASKGFLYWDWCKLWSFIFIRDHAAASKLGQWQLKAYIKDVHGTWDLEYSENFTISERFVIPSVPHHYQTKSYYCGPASLEMVFDFYGPDISQGEIADVARTDPSYGGTYTDDMRRAAHFSKLSSSVGNEMPGSIEGYTKRKIGYAAFEQHFVSAVELKSLIDAGYPIVVLTWFDSNKNSGHYRVVIGYTGYDNTITRLILHDPWFGANIEMDYEVFSDFWIYSSNWGLFVSPWNVSVACPPAVEVGANFTVIATVTYTCPQPFHGLDYPVSSCKATIQLPSGLSLAPGETLTKDLNPESMHGGDTATVEWRVQASIPSPSYVISINASGQVQGYTFTHGSFPGYTYSDLIGGSGSSEVEVALPHIRLGSEEDDGFSANLGSIVFDGSTYSLPNLIVKDVGNYSIDYDVAFGYMFDRWETTGGVTVADPYAHNTTVFVSGDGTLTAIYKTLCVHGYSRIRTTLVFGEGSGAKSTNGPVKVVKLGVYSDVHCSNQVPYIDWGCIPVGTTQNISLFLRNEGNIEISLALETENWTPKEVVDYADLSWNYYGEILEPNEVVEVTLTLWVSGSNASKTYFLDNKVEDFVFDIIFVLNEPPVAALSVDKNTLDVNEPVTFNASSSTDDGTIVSYFFDFGDGTNSGWTSSAVTTHIYLSEGTYNATVIVMDDYGAVSSNTELIKVQITVIPEFQSSIILPILMAITLLAAILRKKLG